MKLSLKSKLRIALQELIDNAPLDHMGTGNMESERMSERDWMRRIAKLKRLIRLVST